MTSVARFGPMAARIAGAGLALAMLSACGSSSEPTTPAKDVTPATIAAVSTDTLRAVSGSAIATSLTVTVKNAAGSPIDSALVTFAVASGGGTINPTSIRTNASGQAATTWTLGPTVGTQTVTATVGTLPAVTFVAIASAGTAASIAKLAGDAQTGVVNTNLPALPSVKVTDRLGNPVAGQPVTFTAGSSGGLVNGGSVNTGSDGVATVAGWRLGPTVGTYTIVASAGTGVTTTFTATAIAGPPAVLTISPVGPFALDAGQTVVLTPRVTDAAGNVLAGVPITYASANPAVASVANNGTVTAAGAGVTTITVASGTAFATATVNVTGHPVGTSIVSSQNYNTFLSDLAITPTTIGVGLSPAQQVAFLDPTATSAQGSVLQLSTPVPILLGGRSNSAGPLLAVNQGTTSRVWFIDQISHAVIDSTDIAENVVSAAINSTGTRAFLVLSNGEMAVIDVPSRTQLPRIGLGGGTAKVKIDRGDTLVYVSTNIGIMFEVDARTNAIRRQIILPNVAVTDFDISRDGTRLFLLDGNPGLVRIYNIATLTLQRTAQVSGNAISIGLSPDDAQIWTTHTIPSQVTWYTGSITTGYLATGVVTTAGLPVKVYFSPTGDFAAIVEQSGVVDIIR